MSLLPLKHPLLIFCAEWEDHASLLRGQPTVIFSDTKMVNMPRHPTICKSPHCIEFLVLRLVQLCFQFTFRRQAVLPLPYLLEDNSCQGRTSQNKIALSLSRV